MTAKASKSVTVRQIKSGIGFGEIDDGKYDQRHRCLPSGGATLVSASVFRELNGFDPIFDPFGAEDTDFSFRVRAAGYYALYVPDSIVYHDYTRKDRQFSDKYIAARVRQWMVLFSRHATLPEKIAFFAGGGFVGFLKIVLREIRKGNLSSIKGILAGLREYATREPGKEATGQDAPDVGVKPD